MEKDGEEKERERGNRILCNLFKNIKLNNIELDIPNNEFLY